MSSCGARLLDPILLRPASGSDDEQFPRGNLAAWPFGERPRRPAGVLRNGPDTIRRRPRPGPMSFPPKRLDKAILHAYKAALRA